MQQTEVITQRTTFTCTFGKISPGIILEEVGWIHDVIANSPYLTIFKIDEIKIFRFKVFLELVPRSWEIFLTSFKALTKMFIFSVSWGIMSDIIVSGLA